jgi:hypothetical protein
LIEAEVAAETQREIAIITLQAMQGNSKTTIARWVGNLGRAIMRKIS